jgi:hypothetical protein
MAENPIGMRQPRTSKRLAGATLSILATLLVGCQDVKIPDALLRTPPPKALGVASPSPTPAELIPTTLEVPNQQLSRSRLRNYYLHKYSAEQLESTRAAVALVLPNYNHSDALSARAEMLAFNYVVFHETEYHRLNVNHNTIRPYEALLKRLCHNFDVPLYPVLAIVSWENSGARTKVSWANAAGLGQMTWGAIEQAHASARKIALGLREKAKAHPEQAPQLLAEADLLNLSDRHQKYARAHHLPDERFSPEANLEDVVMFFKFLLEEYGGDIDLAIVAYHQGVGNMDDILQDYLSRKDPSAPTPDIDRRPFIDALKRWNITYVTLWNDLRSRQMLNGLRTMKGVTTTPDNIGDALGDESDIYLWKVLGSLAGYERGDAFVQKQMALNKAPQAQVEMAGLPIYDSADAIHRALDMGTLVQSRFRPVPDRKGTPALTGSFVGEDTLVTPELEGYLIHLTDRFRVATGNAQASLPLRNLMAVRSLQAGSRSLFTRVQLRGVTAVLVPSRLEDLQHQALARLLTEDFTMDRIYKVSLRDKSQLLCLNPRYGDEFLNYYRPAADDAQPTSPDSTPDAPRQAQL